MSTLPQTMKAATLKGRNNLEVKEIPTPVPGPMEVLLKVESCACCSTDVALMDEPLPGQPPYGSFVPGHEYAGVVAALGPDVDEFKVGDRVAVEAHLGCLRCKNCRVGNYTACLNYGTSKHRANGMTANGGFAQYVINNINTVHAIPDHIDFDEASLVTNLGCVLYGFETIGGYVAGNQVVVIGPGPLGLISAQVAKALGAINRKFLALAKHDWQEDTFHSSRELPEPFLNSLRKLTEVVGEQLAQDPTFLQQHPLLLEFYFDALHFLRVCEQWGEDFRCELSRNDTGQGLRIRLNCLDPARLLVVRLGKAGHHRFLRRPSERRLSSIYVPRFQPPVLLATSFVHCFVSELPRDCRRDQSKRNDAHVSTAAVVT